MLERKVIEFQEKQEEDLYLNEKVKALKLKKN